MSDMKKDGLSGTWSGAKKHGTLLESVRQFLADNGAKGGKKSRRKLSKKEARRIASIRWDKTRLAISRQSA